MEKKTIGKFIAVLRKANGMTQKDLADKLFVSDKTVSRWERDECDPELSLIPAIAEIFGITTDELLRGERNSLEATITEETKPSAKSDKQFKTMLRARVRKYKNLSLISFGLIFAGLITAVICHNVFHNAILAICLTTLFILSSAISQYIFGTNAFIPKDEDDNTYEQQINQANTTITKIATTIYFCAVIVFSFCFPLAFSPKRTSVDINGNYVHHYYHYGDNWLNWGLFCVIVGLTVCGLIYLLFLKHLLIKKGLITVAENKVALVKYRRKILTKVASIGFSVLIILVAAIIIIYEIGIMGFVKEEVYETFEEFGSAMLEDHKEYIEFLREFKSFVIYDDGHLVNMESEIPDDHKLAHKVVNDFEGNVVFEYDYNTDLYFDIRFSFRNDRLPVTVVTNDSYRNAKGIYNSIIYSALIAAAIDIAACAAIYFISAYGKKSKKI